MSDSIVVRSASGDELTLTGGEARFIVSMIRAMLTDDRCYIPDTRRREWTALLEAVEIALMPVV